MDDLPNKIKDLIMFWRNFYKIILLMMVEDLTFYSLGRFEVPVFFIVPLLAVLALLFTKWLVK
jgi:hypothetical protein